jgi:multidrug efflux system membrane fusion protein
MDDRLIKIISCKRLLPVTVYILLCCAGCTEPPGQQGDYQAQPPEVTVARPIRKQVTDWDEYTGRFSAVETVEIRSRVSGYLEQVNFTEGSIVAQDTLLFIIDPRPYQALLDEKQADEKQAQALLRRAENELRRDHRLFDTRAISADQLDLSTQARNEAQAALEAARAQVQSATLDLDFTRIRAPVSGRISRALVTRGNLVSGGSENSTLLTTIVSMDPIYFYFTSDEQAYLHYIRLDLAGERKSSYAKRNPVRLRIGDETEFLHQGYMDFVDNRLDESTGTMLVRAVFDNPDHLFVPGMFGKIQLLGEGPYPAMLIPPEAIANDQGRQIVYVIDEHNTARIKRIDPGQLLNGLRIVREGLAADDRIVINGIQRVRPGMEVSPAETTLSEQGDSQAAGL